MSRRHFDPVAIFPSRIASEKPWTAMSADDNKLSGGVKGCSNAEKQIAVIPTANTAYNRHVRYHESLHGIYSKPSRDKKEYMLRGQVLEDSRLHLLHSRASGLVRRDELTAVLRDMLNSRKKRDMLNSRKKSDLVGKAYMGLRAAAHLYAEGADKKPTPAMEKLLQKHCAEVSEDFLRDVMLTLDAIRKGDNKLADSLMTKYVPDEPESETEILVAGMWPSATSGEDGPTIADDVPVNDYKPEKGEASFTPGDGGKTPIESKFEKSGMPHLYIRHLYAVDNVKTYTGARDKRSLSGFKIKASRLACVVGPGNPRIFERIIHRDGGTVLIDASGSMKLTPEMLLELVSHAPLATIAMYNSQTDSPRNQSENFGNMWIFSHNAKRAADFSGIRFANGTAPKGHKGAIAKKLPFPKDTWVGGNLVDYPAMLWLLSQAAPRYMLTDCGWTGHRDNYQACVELFSRITSQKKVMHVRTMDELQTIFARRGKR